MAELLQPFNKKQNEETIRINEVKRSIDFLKKKTEDHDFLLNTESAEKPTYIQAQDDKIQELNNQIKEHKIET